ncbi:Aste57867_14623 [Aphanomyces stellatus]|uniref:Aste57867_14623 protein n=1 Tax=Aphanomyces stellatus TaxID=120398 RepID=A0A485L2U8_9STRA|nr:hypothetical protein As57867_014568 [Aphanomyces stellatus]VFT91442.1 Aste57867_14623 [Aphanomyces stellatus]
MNGDDGAAWDVARDLPFLIASDVELQTELAELCDLMDETSPATLASPEEDSSKPKRRRKPSAAPAGARNQHQARVRQDILDLREEVERLVKELDDAMEKSLLQRSADVPPWRKLAKMQEGYASKALQENRRLRAAVNEQGSFIGKMTKVMRKKPRLDGVDEAAAWCDYKLAAQQSLREIGIHAIADRQFRCTDTVFLNAGLVGREDNCFSVGPLHSSDTSVVVFQVRSHVKLAAPCRVVSRAVWQVNSGDMPLPMSTRASVNIERLDEYTVYEQFAETNANGIVSYANTVRKLYTDDGAAHVMVWRSVLEDALVPHMSKGAVDDECGWVVVTPIDDESCWESFVVHIRIDPSTFPSPPSARHLVNTTNDDDEARIDDIAALVRQLTVEEAPPALGKFIPPDNRTAIELGLPLYAPFFERGYQFERTVKAAVNHAIDSYQRSREMLEQGPSGAADDI